VVADSDLAASIQAAAEHYLHIPWAAVLLSKRMTNQAFDLPFDDFLPQYFAAQTEAMRSADHIAALRAYREEQAQKRRQR